MVFKELLQKKKKFQVMIIFITLFILACSFKNRTRLKNI